ncbi:MAG: hypothetical protein PHO02_02305 [Candidatus Nanoarchaeia archaeon]|nr:hypothetical protein [Candidatus Nanoarchaeia archaeon]
MGLEQALGKYEYFLNDEDASIYIGASGVETYKDKVDFVLSPEEINEFLQKAMDFNFEQHRYSEITGMYVTKLMQNYINACSDYPFFKLDLPVELDCLGFGLKAKGAFLFLDIKGNLGDSCFTGSLGCSADIFGDVKDNFARCSMHSFFRVTGNVGYGSAGHSQKCVYEFFQKVGRGFDCAESNEFRAFTPEGLKTLKKYVPAGNSISYLEKDKFVDIKRLRDKFPFLEKFMRRH